MKQFRKLALVVLIIIALTLTLAACGSSDTQEDTSEGSQLKDGTYTGEGEKREFGYEAAEVTIENGQISNIVLKRMEPDGTEVDYDEWTGEGDDGKPNLKQFKEDLAEEMVAKQSYEVDAISTATDTSEGWKEAVKEALDKAK